MPNQICDIQESYPVVTTEVSEQCKKLLAFSYRHSNIMKLEVSFLLLLIRSIVFRDTWRLEINSVEEYIQTLITIFVLRTEIMRCNQS